MPGGSCRIIICHCLVKDGVQLLHIDLYIDIAFQKEFLTLLNPIWIACNGWQPCRASLVDVHLHEEMAQNMTRANVPAPKQQDVHLEMVRA